MKSPEHAAVEQKNFDFYFIPPWYSKRDDPYRQTDRYEDGPSNSGMLTPARWECGPAQRKSHLFTSNLNAALSVAKAQSSSGTAEGSQLQSIWQWKSRVSRDWVVFSHLLLLDFIFKAVPSPLAVPRQCRLVLHGGLHVC